MASAHWAALLPLKHGMLIQNANTRLQMESFLTSKDFWSAFRICSLYDTSEDYKKAGTEQCAIAKEDRALFMKFILVIKRILRLLIIRITLPPFECDEKIWLVVADESHLQSGAMIKSLYKIAYEGRFIALVGDHQMTEEQPSIYGAE